MIFFYLSKEHLFPWTSAAVHTASSKPRASVGGRAGTLLSKLTWAPSHPGGGWWSLSPGLRSQEGLSTSLIHACVCTLHTLGQDIGRRGPGSPQANVVRGCKGDRFFFLAPVHGVLPVEFTLCSSCPQDSSLLFSVRFHLRSVLIKIESFQRAAPGLRDEFRPSFLSRKSINVGA